MSTLPSGQLLGELAMLKIALSRWLLIFQISLLVKPGGNSTLPSVTEEGGDLSLTVSVKKSAGFAMVFSDLASSFFCFSSCAIAFFSVIFDYQQIKSSPPPCMYAMSTEWGSLLLILPLVHLHSPYPIHSSPLLHNVTHLCIISWSSCLKFVLRLSWYSQDRDTMSLNTLSTMRQSKRSKGKWRNLTTPHSIYAAVARLKPEALGIKASKSMADALALNSARCSRVFCADVGQSRGGQVNNEMRKGWQRLKVDGAMYRWAQWWRGAGYISSQDGDGSSQDVESGVGSCSKGEIR